jgi:hypothetical protein
MAGAAHDRLGLGQVLDYARYVKPSGALCYCRQSQWMIL